LAQTANEVPDNIATSVSQRLIDAATVGDVPAMEQALRDGAGADARVLVDDEGGFKTDMHCAISARSAGAVALLLRHGADPNLHGPMNPLGWSVRLCQLEMCTMLIDAGAHLRREAENYRLMHDALRSRSAVFVKLLLDAGAPMTNVPHLRKQLADLARSSGDETLAQRIQDAPC